MQVAPQESTGRRGSVALERPKRPFSQGTISSFEASTSSPAKPELPREPYPNLPLERGRSPPARQQGCTPPSYRDPHPTSQIRIVGSYSQDQGGGSIGGEVAARVVNFRQFVAPRRAVFVRGKAWLIRVEVFRWRRFLVDCFRGEASASVSPVNCWGWKS